ncbi:MAG: hypothetical protein DRI97_15980 [Bacteroidetes bacterium]|jgi:hypothetical protein|nr:MAG: hypothetical protein DRI97_15980 [Bacteroidota bacterium]
MGNDLIHIYSVEKAYLAELIKQMLADHNIRAFLVNKQDSAYKFGEIEVFVDRDDVIRAKMLIQEFEDN